jgi:hypothetical protein
VSDKQREEKALTITVSGRAARGDASDEASADRERTDHLLAGLQDAVRRDGADPAILREIDAERGRLKTRVGSERTLSTPRQQQSRRRFLKRTVEMVSKTLEGGWVTVSRHGGRWFVRVEGGLDGAAISLEEQGKEINQAVAAIYEALDHLGVVSVAISSDDLDARSSRGPGIRQPRSRPRPAP